MIELNQLEQLCAIHQYNTISKAAEYLNISQPALSRSMQKLEYNIGVTLFSRQKNKVELNANGLLAVEYAEKILLDAKNMQESIKAYDRSRHTITVGSCAPAPLWNIVPTLSTFYPDLTISQEIKNYDELIEGLNDNTYHIIVMPYQANDMATILCKKCGTEKLFFSLPPAHPLSESKGLYFSDINGENMLLLSQIGFWHDIHALKMPDTHFLLQEEWYTFDTLIQASALPSFISDIVIEKYGSPENRMIIPILDKEASVTYYCWCRKENKNKLLLFFKNISY